MGAPLAAVAQPSLAVQAEGVVAIGIPKAADKPAAAETPVPAGVPASAEVQAIWDLGAAGNWESASRRLASLEASNAGWRAPANLKTYLSTGQRDHRISAALEQKDWQGALAPIPPAGKTTCESPFHLWARADAVEGLAEPGQIQSFYIRVLSNCKDATLVAALAERSLGVLDADGLASLREISSLRQSADPAIMIAYAQLQRAESRLRFEAAVDEDDLETVSVLAASSDDPHVLNRAGWAFFDRDASVSAGYFERALERGAGSDARRGFVMAMLATGNLSSARRAIAEAPDPEAFSNLVAQADLGEARLRRKQGDWQDAIALAEGAAELDASLARDTDDLIGGSLLDAAGRAYDTGDFAGARQLAERASDYSSARRAGLMRAAWSDLQMGNATEAASAFSHLYLEAPDAEAAEGYAFAAERAGDLGTAAALARTLGGPLGAQVDARYAQAAFNDGGYLTARAYAPETYAALEGIDGSWYRQAVSVRSQGGKSGENRLRGFVSTTSAGTARGADRFEAGVSVYSLDPGRSLSSAQRASRETFATPYVAWSREGETSLAARIGLLPVGADADPILTGEVAMQKEFAGRVIEARAFSRPKTDSALSFAGQQDNAGTAFGRVAETGAQVRGRMPVGDLNSIQADVSAAHLGGENTADNSVLSAGIAASRAIRRDGFAYLVTGPFYQFQSYDRNANFFTPGHGGYFSPQSFHRAGWSMNAQTDPLKDWILKADVAVAYESTREDAAPENPLLSGPQPVIGGSRSTGVASALDFSAARRISREVVLSANLSAIASQAYEDFRFGIALTWVPGGRSGLVRSDLPVDPFNPGSWVQP